MTHTRPYTHNAASTTVSRIETLRSKRRGPCGNRKTSKLHPQNCSFHFAPYSSLMKKTLNRWNKLQKWKREHRATQLSQLRIVQTRRAAKKTSQQKDVREAESASVYRRRCNFELFPYFQLCETTCHSQRSADLRGGRRGRLPVLVVRLRRRRRNLSLEQ